MAKGRKANPIEVEHTCPQTGKTCRLTLKRVVDEPAIPGTSHYEVERVAQGEGGLLDGVEPATEAE